MGKYLEFAERDYGFALYITDQDTGDVWRVGGFKDEDDLNMWLNQNFEKNIIK